MDDLLHQDLRPKPPKKNHQLRRGRPWTASTARPSTASTALLSTARPSTATATSRQSYRGGSPAGSSSARSTPTLQPPSAHHTGAASELEPGCLDSELEKQRLSDMLLAQHRAELTPPVVSGAVPWWEVIVWLLQRSPLAHRRSRPATARPASSITESGNARARPLGMSSRMSRSSNTCYTPRRAVHSATTRSTGLNKPKSRGKGMKITGAALVVDAEELGEEEMALLIKERLESCVSDQLMQSIRDSLALTKTAVATEADSQPSDTAHVAPSCKGCVHCGSQPTKGSLRFCEDCGKEQAVEIVN